MENIIVTSVRLEKRMIKELDFLAEEENTDRTTILREALTTGIAEMRIKNALALYQKGKISVGRASEIAKVNLWEFLEILKERKIGFRTDEDDLERQLKEALK